MLLYLEPEEIERVRRFGEVRSYGAGEALFRVGEMGHGLFVILSGHVDLIRHLESGALKTFLTQGPGAVAGEMAQLAGQPHRIELDGFESVPCAPAPSGMVAFWPGDMHAHDLISGLNGTEVGTLFYDNGKVSSAFGFDGAGEVNVPHDSKLNLQVFTLEAWVYPTSLSSSWSDIIYKDKDTYFLMGTTPQGQKPDLGGAFATANVYGAGPLPLNRWSHLAGTYDGITMRFYLNGVLIASRPQAGAIPVVSGSLSIGGDATSGQNWTGLIDDVRIYSRAMNQDQIHTDMNTPVGAPVAKPPTNSGARVVSN
jgi:hypothetical protein